MHKTAVFFAFVFVAASNLSAAMPAEMMLDNKPMTSGPEKFVPADQMLRSPVGRFAGTAAPANAKITNVNVKKPDPAVTPAG